MLEQLSHCLKCVKSICFERYADISHRSQLVVVGDQSSGKSSLLESLTGFSFPHGASLCTRYATQITCARKAQEKILVTIIPRPDADSTLKNRLLAFSRELRRMDNEDLTKIFEEVNCPHT